ncbi:MAG TPA: hypothetical protein VGM27_26470 [Acidobacteriaceae bacterium]
MDVLTHAYACCRANKGAPGVDGLTFDGVEAYGEERWIGELAQQLREETYRPQAVRTVYIPKPDGKQTPLGIPRLAERVCQMAAMLVLEPIFEADLPSEQHAYRQNRNAHSAVCEVRRFGFWCSGNRLSQQTLTSSKAGQTNITMQPISTPSR